MNKKSNAYQKKSHYIKKKKRNMHVSKTSNSNFPLQQHNDKNKKQLPPFINSKLVIVCVLAYLFFVFSWILLSSFLQNHPQHQQQQSAASESVVGMQAGKEQQQEQPAPNTAAAAIALQKGRDEKKRSQLTDFAKSLFQLTSINKNNNNNNNNNNRKRKATTSLVAHDVMDTLILMNLQEESDQALSQIVQETEQPQEEKEQEQVREIAERLVGGMIGAYSLTYDQRFLDRALFHASFLKAYSSLDRRQDDSNQTSSSSSSSSSVQRCRRPLSEVFSLPVPFSYLSFLTNDDVTYKNQAIKFQSRLIEAGLLGGNSHGYSSSSSSLSSSADFLNNFADKTADIVTLENEQEEEEEEEEKDAKRREKMERKGTSRRRKEGKRGESSFGKSMLGGLLPSWVDCSFGTLFSGSISISSNEFGSVALQLDSYLKQWIILTKATTASQENDENSKTSSSSAVVARKQEEQREKEEQERKKEKEAEELVILYEDALDSMIKNLLRYTASTSRRRHFAFVGGFSIDFDETMDMTELCKLPGILILGLTHDIHGHRHQNSKKNQKGQKQQQQRSPSSFFFEYARRAEERKERSHYWNSPKQIEALASDLLTSCVSVMLSTPSHQLPTRVRARSEDGFLSFLHESDRRASLSAASSLSESLLYFYRFTKDEGLREIAGELVESLLKFAPQGIPLADISAPNNNNNNNRGRGSDSVAKQKDIADLFRVIKFSYLLFSENPPTTATGQKNINNNNNNNNKKITGEILLLSPEQFVFDHGGHPYRLKDNSDDEGEEDHQD